MTTVRRADAPVAASREAWRCAPGRSGPAQRSRYRSTGGGGRAHIWRSPAGTYRAPSCAYQPAPIIPVGAQGWTVMSKMWIWIALGRVTAATVFVAVMGIAL